MWNVYIVVHNNFAVHSTIICVCVCVCVDGSMHATAAEKGTEGKKSEKGTLYVWVGSEGH